MDTTMLKEKIFELSEDLKESVRNQEITEKEAEIEFKAMVKKWESELISN